MHFTLLAVLWFVSAVTAHISDEEPRGYHQLVGIPRAERIKAYEERIQSEGNSRIYRGSDVAEQQLTYYAFFAGLIVHLLKSGYVSYCGASLVSHNMLVTAAHCWADDKLIATHLTVVLGSRFLMSGGTRIETSNVIPHPRYNDTLGDHDIAVIHLPSSIEFSSTIFPISLPRGRWLNLTFASMFARAVGIGDTEEDEAADAGLGEVSEHIMRAADLRVLTDDECRDTAGGYVPTGTLCTSGDHGKCPCHGDSGGPLFLYNVNRKYLIGIATRVYGCGTGVPAIYTRVSNYGNFIRLQGRLPSFSYHFEEQESGVVMEDITISYTVNGIIKRETHSAIAPVLS